MHQYTTLLKTILKRGEVSTDRTGVGKRSLFGHQMRFDLRDGFPLLGLRHIPLRLVAEELFWFLSGSTNLRDLQARGVRFWDAWETEWEGDLPDGYLGPIYGAQWRLWHDGDLDQISALIYGLKRDPFSRRHIVTAWNPTDVEYMRTQQCKAPPPCHILFQCYASPDRCLDLQIYQRSADVVIGVPFNIASYALLLELLGCVTNLKPRYLVHTLGDAHIYEYPEHLAATHEMLRREKSDIRSEGCPRPLPTLSFNPSIAGKEIFVIAWEDLRLEGYNPHPAIKDLPVAV